MLNYTTTLEKEQSDKVSGVSIKELLPNTTLFAHVIPWHTSPNVPSHKLDPSGYNSEDLYTCLRQVQDIKRRGFDGVWVTWQGSAVNAKSVAARRLLDCCEAEGLHFVVSLDQSAVRWATTDPTKYSSIANSCYIYAANNFFNNPAYFRINGKPVLSEFGLETLNVDMNIALANIPQSPIMIYRNSNGLSRPQSAGAYAWLDQGLAYLDWFYSQVKQFAKPGQFVFGSIFPGFDNSLATWAVKNGGTEPDKVIDRRMGQLWLDTIAKFKASGCTYGQVATWNDHEEGTGIEFGINGGVTVSLDKNFLPVTTGLVHHTEMFITDNGKNLAPYDPAATLAPGTYQIYAKAVGMPSIINAMSLPATYVVPDAADTKIAADLLAAVRRATM